jgi:hypothetical protein
MVTYIEVLYILPRDHPLGLKFFKLVTLLCFLVPKIRQKEFKMSRRVRVVGIPQELFYVFDAVTAPQVWSINLSSPLQYYVGHDWRTRVGGFHSL